MTKNIDTVVAVHRGGMEMWRGVIKAAPDLTGTHVVEGKGDALTKKVQKEVAFDLLDGDVITVL